MVGKRRQRKERNGFGVNESGNGVSGTAAPAFVAVRMGLKKECSCGSVDGRKEACLAGAAVGLSWKRVECPRRAQARRLGSAEAAGEWGWEGKGGDVDAVSGE